MSSFRPRRVSARIPTPTGEDRAALKLFVQATASADDPREIVSLYFLQAAAWKRLGHDAESRAALEAVRRFAPATKDEKKEAKALEENQRNAE